MGLRDVVAKRKAERERPKTLAELRAQKKAASSNGKKPKTLAELRARKQAQSSKLDFHVGGVRYHNVRNHGHWWSIDVSNGDTTYTLHNRHSAWFCDTGKEGVMAEPVQVARALGTDLTQLAISQALSERLEREMRDRGIPTREELLRQHEEEAKAARRKRRKQPSEDPAD